MKTPRTAESPDLRVDSRRDPGTTFIELLISIVLLGTVVLAVLIALQVATMASATDANHARAFILLHDASDSIFEADRMSCIEDLGDADTDGPDDEVASNWGLVPTADIVQHYNNAILGSVSKPEGWDLATVEVTDVQFLYKDQTTDFTWKDDTFPYYCQEGVRPDGPDIGTNEDDYRDEPLFSQKVTITVTAPNGSFTKELETVISE